MEFELVAGGLCGVAESSHETRAECLPRSSWLPEHPVLEVLLIVVPLPLDAFPQVLPTPLG